MNKKNKFLAMLLVFIMTIALVPKSIAFANSKTFIRVEGFDKTIVEGEAEGTTVYEVLEALLKEKGIEYVIEDGYYGPYLTEIDGLKSGKFGGYDGWMYFIQNGSSITSDRTDIQAGDEVVFYYGDFDKTSLVNNVIFNPEVPKENEEFELKIQYSYFDWATNEMASKNLSNVKCVIDNKEYLSNEEGIIKLNLQNGIHTYEFSSYAENDVPFIVLTKGTFKLDSINKPVLLFNDSDYNKVQDNKLIKEDIKETLAETTNYLVNNNNSPWGAFSLYKLGKSSKMDFLENIKNATEDLSVLSAGELESSTIGIASLGYNPKNFMKKDFVKELFSRDLNKFLTNEIMFAIITMNALNIKDEYKITEKDLVNELLNRYDEGWNWTSGLQNKTDIDMTAAAISALSPYYNGKAIDGVDNLEVVNKVNEAVQILKSRQSEDGHIASTYGTSAETDAFVILALVSIGIDPSGESFTKESGNLTQAFLSYKGSQGAFNHNDSMPNNAYATENALRALIALNNFNQNAYNYYSSDIDLDKLKIYEEDKEDIKEDNKEDLKEYNKDETNNNKEEADETAEDIQTADNNLTYVFLIMMLLSSSYIVVYRRKYSEV